MAFAAILVCAIGVPVCAQDERPKTVTPNAQTNQRRAQQPARFPNSQTAQPQRDPTASVTPNSNEQTVRVTAAPPISVQSKKDKWDIALVIFTGLLVIVGAFQIIFLWRTVGATHANAIAARDNAKALIASERAWLHGDLVKREILTGVTPRYSLVVTNQGKTPAQVLGYDVWHGLLTEGAPFSKDRLQHFSESKEISIGGNQTETLRDDFNLDDFFTFESGDTASSRGIPKGAVCIAIRYADVVTEGPQKRQHQTSFVYECDLFLARITRIAQYNEYT